MNKKWIAVLIGGGVALSAQAADTTWMVQAGRRGDIESVGVGARFAPFWSYEWGAADLTLRPELQVNRHRVFDDDVPGPSALWQAGGAAILQAFLGEGALRPYLEIGLGINYLTRSELGDDQYSTRFQFGEHLGAGIAMRDDFFAGVRISHYSNGGLMQPNNGLNAAQVLIGARF